MDLNLNAINSYSYSSPAGNVGRNNRENPADSTTASAPPAPATEQATTIAAAPVVLNNAVSAASSALQSQLFDRQREAVASQTIGNQTGNTTVPASADRASNAPPQSADTSASLPGGNPPAQRGGELADGRFSGNPARQAVAQYQANQSLLQDAGTASGPAISASA